MPTPRRCSGCGASLGEPADDDLTIVCTFCGLRHDLNAVAGAAAPVVIQLGPSARRAGGAVIGSILAIVAAVVGLGLFLAYRTARQVTSTVQDATAAVRARTAESRRPIGLADLATLTDAGWKALDAPPPPGGFTAFEPVAALPWAMTIGRAWAADAALTRIDVGRVSATGVVDLTGESTSGYRFVSAARATRWKQETDAGSRSTTATGLLLQLQGATARVLVQNHDRDEPKTPEAASLSLAELLERARAGRGFSDRPFYSGYLIHLPREGWVWYFQAPSGDSFPRVRARDGRVYPY